MVAFAVGSAAEITAELPVVLLSTPFGLSVPMIARTLNPPPDCGTNDPSPGAPTTNQFPAVFQSVLTSPCQKPSRASASPSQLVAMSTEPTMIDTRKILEHIMVVPPMF